MSITLEKNCKKNWCFGNHSVVNNSVENNDAKLEACLLPKMAIFNLRGRGEEKEKMARGGLF